MVACSVCGAACASGSDNGPVSDSAAALEKRVCAACATGPIVWSDPALGPGWSRASFGECFTLEPSWPRLNLHSVEWYERGVTIP